MARSHRLDPEMGIHHVYTRGTKRWTIFHDDMDRHRFMGRLSTVCDRYDVSVLAYALMDNHLHLVLRCVEGGLSEALRDLKSDYARWFNTRHRSSGPLFEGRFGSKLVTSHRQLRTVVRYVHRNPLDIDAAMDLASYPWSSHGAYAKLRPAPVWLDTEVARPLFSDYRAEVERPLATDAVQNRPVSPTPSVKVPGTLTLESASSSIGEIVVAVAHAAGKSVAEVQPGLRNGLVGIAALIALRYEGLTSSETYEPLGYSRYNSLMAAVARTAKRIESDPAAEQLLVEARRRLGQRAA